MSSPAVTATWGAESWSPVLIEALAQEAVLLQAGANRIVVEGREVHVPRLLVAPDADWVEELDELPSDAGDADTLDLVPKKIANIITLSRESVEDAPGDQLNRIGQAMVRGVALKVDAKAFSNAAASAAAPAGLLNGSVPGAAGTVDIPTIVGGVGAVQAAGGRPNAIFVNPSDITDLRLEALSGSYATLADPTAPGIERVAGARLWPTSAIAAGTALIADMAYVVVAVRRDATVEFSTDAAFSVDGVAARITMRVDFGLSDPNAVYHIA